MLTTSQRNKQKNATQIVLQASTVRPFANSESFTAMAASPLKRGDLVSNGHCGRRMA